MTLTNNPIDWHHFQPSRATAQLLAIMPYPDAKTLFECYAQKPSLLNAVDAKDNQFIRLYNKNPTLFMRYLPQVLEMDPAQAVQFLAQKIEP